MGRPTKLNDETQNAIVKAIKLGATYELAASAGGISYKSFNEWMKQGEAAKKGKFRAFFQAIKKAEGDAVKKWLETIEKAAESGNWTAAAWKLERRYPKAYGRNVQDVSHSGDITIQFSWKNDDDTDSA